MAYTLDDYLGVVTYFSVQVIGILMFLTVIFGALLFAAPSVIQKINLFTAKATSMRKPLKAVEIMRESRPALEKYRKVVGIAFTLGALEVLYFCFAKMDTVLLARVWTEARGAQIFLEAVFETVRVVFIFGAVLAIPTMLAFAFAPGAYQKMSNLADRWLSTRLAMLPMEKARYVDGAIFFKHHRLFGLMILGLSLFAIIQLMALPDRFGW